jgi:CysZ protein
MGLFAGLLVMVEFAVSHFTNLPGPWLTALAQFLAGLGLVAAFFFLMAPVTALFAGLFQDGISAKLEARHYAASGVGKPLAWHIGLVAALKFAGLALAVEAIVFPLVFFFGFGAVLIWLANGYLIGREYFELAAARHMPMAEAVALRRAHAIPVFLAGLIPGALAMVPFVNFVTPVFATSFFLHYFRQGVSPSA